LWFLKIIYPAPPNPRQTLSVIPGLVAEGLLRYTKYIFENRTNISEKIDHLLLALKRLAMNNFVYGSLMGSEGEMDG
jgi:hypothetical protein